MAFLFDQVASLTRYISFDDNNPRLYARFSMSIGGWFKFRPINVSGGIGTFFMQNHSFGGDNDFSPTQIRINQFDNHGVDGYFQYYGGQGTVLDVRPSTVKPEYAWPGNRWMYFGISRDSAAGKVFSYFGSKLALIDGPIAVQTTQATIALAGSFVDIAIGSGENNGQISKGLYIGPWSYWDKALTKDEHLAMARCQTPSDTSHLLLWNKMLALPDDSGPLAIHPTIHTFADPPVYVPDSGCQSFGHENYFLTSP